MYTTNAIESINYQLRKPNGGDQLAHALLSTACTTEVTTEQVYLALITPPENPDDHSESLPS